MTNSPGWLCQACKNRVPFGQTHTCPAFTEPKRLSELWRVTR